MEEAVILNVDDNDAGRYARSRILQRAGFRVLEAATGSEALEIVQRDRSFRDDIGRVKMLEVFEMAAAQPEIVDEYRGRLSRILF